MWIQSKMPKRDREDVSRASGNSTLCFIQIYFTIFFTNYTFQHICFMQIIPFGIYENSQPNI